MKKIYTKEEIKENSTVEIITGSAFYTDEFGNLHNIDEDIEQAEKDIELIKSSANVHFRWNQFEVKRAKKIAEKLGMPYQTYIKSTLKQAMDEFEQKQM
jgi:predicted DNA binding CopG/RHH family protein